MELSRGKKKSNFGTSWDFRGVSLEPVATRGTTRDVGSMGTPMGTTGGGGWGVIVGTPMEGNSAGYPRDLTGSHKESRKVLWDAAVGTRGVLRYTYGSPRGPMRDRITSQNTLKNSLQNRQ